MSLLRRRQRLLLAALAVSGMALTGCAEDVPTRAGTIDDPSSTVGGDASAGDDPGDANQEADLSRAGRALTQKEAKSALPEVGLLPAGWSVDPESTLTGDDEDDSDDDTVRPERCAVVFNGLEDLEPGEAAADAGVTFTAGMLGPWLGLEISSFDDPIPEEQFTRVLEALGECPKFSVDDGESVAKFRASALSFPNFGEESAALRMTGTAEGMAFGMDLVVIRAGHNLVSISQMSLGGAGAIKPLQKAARATVANLNS